MHIITKYATSPLAKFAVTLISASRVVVSIPFLSLGVIYIIYVLYQIKLIRSVYLSCLSDDRMCILYVKGTYLIETFSGLTPTTLQALSKLISNGSDVADDIIGVIRSVISQFSVKNLETDTIDVAVNVRSVESFSVCSAYRSPLG